MSRKLRVGASIGLTLSAVLVVGGCTGDDQATSPQAPTTQQSAAPSEPQSTTDEWAGDTIAAGTYSRVATQADAERAGLPEDLSEALLGADGELPMSIEIADGSWTIHVTNDASISEVGDLGTYSYDVDGHWITVSEADRVLGYEWTLVGDVLTLTLVDVEGEPPPWTTSASSPRASTPGKPTDHDDYSEHVSRYAPKSDR